MDAERIAALRRDLDDDVILNREDIRELLDAAERWAVFLEFRQDPDITAVFLDELEEAIVDAASKRR